MRLEEYLVKESIATPTEVSDALDRQRTSRPPIGEIAVREGAMRSRDVDAVLMWKRFDKLRPFGEIAMDLGYINRRQLEGLLRTQGQDTIPLLDVLTAMGILCDGEASQIERDYLWARWEEGMEEQRRRAAF